MEQHLSNADVRINAENGQRQLHALRSFEPGDIIATIGAREILDAPTYLTVQVGVEKHILLEPLDLQYCNHSCEPNVFFDTSAMQVIALKPIQEGEELTFFYPSTEWTMAQPFQCYCGHPNCLGLIVGAASLSTEALNRYRLTEFVLQQRSLRERVIA